MSLKVSIVVGNPKPASRTRRVAEVLVSKLFDPEKVAVETIDLAEHVDEIFVWPSERMAALNAAVAESDVVVLASPTYKATYTGLLKAFLDRYPANGLAGVTAIPIHTGADFSHTMGPTFTLAPLLMELGAVVPGRGFYLSLSLMDKLDAQAEAMAAEYAGNLARLAAVSAATSGAVSSL